MPRLSILFALLLLTSCDNARIEQLEQENQALQQKLDSIQQSNEQALEHVRNVYNEAKLRSYEVRDSVITARGLKVIMVFSSCGDADANEDLARSIDLLVDKLKSQGIEVYRELDATFLDVSCGYTLADGAKRKQIDGSMTDYDLALLISEFYDIELVK